MNQNTLVQIAERLESLAARLPERIRRPVLRELTPLKQLFLQQRRPRFLFIGSSKMPLQKIIDLLFESERDERANVMLSPVHRWTDWTIPGRGTISVLDARGADYSAAAQIEAELKRDPADMIFFFDDGELDLQKPIVVPSGETKIIGLLLGSEQREMQLEEVLDAQPAVRDRLLTVIRITQKGAAETRRLMSILAAELPNEAKIEMIRISRDRQAQIHVAQMLIKSTTAICAAIGTQPIPLADLPILTALQVLMVSGIMYVSGRERSLRSATEFIAALGANLGAGMLLREGARVGTKVFSRLGQRRLRDDRGRRDICYWSSGDGLLSRGRFLKGGTPDVLEK